MGLEHLNSKMVNKKYKLRKPVGGITAMLHKQVKSIFSIYEKLQSSYALKNSFIYAKMNRTTPHHKKEGINRNPDSLQTLQAPRNEGKGLDKDNFLDVKNKFLKYHPA